MSQLINCDNLKEHALWEGSILHTKYRWGGGVCVSDLKLAIDSFDRVEDITELEDDWLALLGQLYSEVTA